MTTQHIQLRRGTAADLPDAGIEGEPRFTTDTGLLYIDDGTNNVLIGGTGASVVNVLGAKGDVPYASAENTLAALNIGSAAQILTVNSGGDAPEWAAPASQVSDTAYAASWDNVTTISPSKNAVYDKIEALVTADTAFMNKTGSNLAIGSDADGDMYYRASSVLARLAKSTANFKLFMNAGATAPEWASGIKITYFSRVMSVDSGDVSYTGAGFKPSAIIVVIGQDGSNDRGGIGFTDGTVSFWTNTVGGQAVTHSANAPLTDSFIEMIASGEGAKAVLKTLDANGCTLTWTKTGGTWTAHGLLIYLR